MGKVSHRVRMSRRNRDVVRAYLESMQCADCGEDNPDVLEFDHVTGEKRKNVSRLVHEGYSLRTIFYEIHKCDVVCANCHRVRTKSRREANAKEEAP